MALAATVVLTLLPQPAAAFSVGVIDGRVVHREDAQVELGYSGIIPPASIEAAASAWSVVPCSDASIVATGGGPPEADNLAAGASPDGEEAVAFISDWTHGEHTAALTVLVVDGPTGLIQETDIGVRLEVLDLYDIQGVLTHELGHVLGLRHNLGPYDDEVADPPTMHPVPPFGLVARDLHPDDQLGSCWLYPADGGASGGGLGGAFGACATDADCPAIVEDEAYAGFATCVGGACSLSPLPGAGLGEPCATDPDCSPSLYCQPTDDGPLCTYLCSPISTGGTGDATCPAGFACRAFDSFPGWGACLPTETTAVITGGGDPGAAPEGEGTCASSPSTPSPGPLLAALALMLLRAALARRRRHGLAEPSESG